jgi:hypothetical protein
MVKLPALSVDAAMVVALINMDAYGIPIPFSSTILPVICLSILTGCPFFIL